MLPPSLLPTYTCNSIYDIDLQALSRAGITLLLADLDNTLARYGQAEPEAELLVWLQALKRHGITLFILSNNRKPERPRHFAAALGTPYLGHAGKPKVGGFLRAMEQMHCTPAQSAMVGDQIFTDILGGSAAGLTTILVEPMALQGNVGRYLRYGAEWPLRMLSRRRRQ